MVAVLARYAARFSVRALDLTVDASLLWVGVGLAVIAAVLLAFVPRLPSQGASKGFGLSSGSAADHLAAPTGGCGYSRSRRSPRRSCCSPGAGHAARPRCSRCRLRARDSTSRNVLAVHVPVMSYGRTPDQVIAFYKEAMRRISELPGVERVAVGTIVPWRDAGGFGQAFNSRLKATNGRMAKRIREHGSGPSRQDSLRRWAYRLSLAGIFPKPIAAAPSPSSSSARAWRSGCFQNREALNRHMMWTDPVMKFIDVGTGPRRIVGIAADVDDENVVPGRR